MTARVRRRGGLLLAGGIAATMLLAACSSGSSSSSSSSAAASDTASASASASASESASASGSAGGDCAAYSAYTGSEGTTVTIFASIIEPESNKFIDSWKQFEQCTGITISYEGSNDFEAQLPVRVQGGTAPDLAFVPQPGLLAKMVETGKVVAAPADTAANVDKYWNPAWKTYGSVNGTFYAAPLGANMKSFVWYSPKAFKAANYTVPTTWDDLMKLSDTIAAAGKGKPWCGGIASGTATGWPATDWTEQLVLRKWGGDVYDQWIAHTVLFDSPQITEVMDILAGWMKNPKWVNGGFGDVKTIATTTFQDAGKPILKGECWMLQQASFYANQWPAGTDVSPNGDVYAFYLPAMGTEFGNPVEGGGEFVTAFADRPEVQKVQTYLSSPEWAAGKVKIGEWVTANNGVPLDTYKADSIEQLSAKYLVDPSATFRFDASDLMPAAVGAGAFWKQMTAWFAEDKPTQAVLKAIDDAWPTS